MEVSLSDMKSLYRRADNDTREFIANKWPDVVKKTSAQEALDSFLSTYNYDLSRKGCRDVYVIADEGLEYIIIELPTANREWTYEVFKFIMHFTKEHDDCYPVHYTDGRFDKYTRTTRPYLVIKYFHY